MNPIFMDANTNFWLKFKIYSEVVPVMTNNKLTRVACCVKIYAFIRANSIILHIYIVPY